MASTASATATSAAWEPRQLLFIYGTLLAPVGDSAVDAAMASGQPLGPAYIHGLLYDLGDYPGVKPVADVATGTQTEIGDPAPKVWGSLLGFPDPEGAFAALDRYEGFDPASPEAGEFARSATEVFVPESDRPRIAQAYFYVPSIAGKSRIPSGDYLSHRGGRPV